MAQAKMMNETAFEKLTKEFGALGELIRTRQDEKQSVMDEFDKEKDRYKKGRISENTFASSVRKTNAELIRIDKNIRMVIQKALKLSSNMSDFLRRQEPKVFRVHESGIKMQGGNKSVKKKPMKKKMNKKPIKKISSKKSPKKKMSKKPRITKAEIAVEMAAEKKIMK